MTEWEKVQKGIEYNDFSDELTEIKNNAQIIFQKYNKTSVKNNKKRHLLLKKLFKSIGNDVVIKSDFKCEYGKNITIGNNVHINFDAIIMDCNEVNIGNNVLIGPRFGIYSANHFLDPEKRTKGACIAEKVIIEDNVWIAGDVKILGGVTIGEGSVIGAGSIVTKDIPKNSLAFGSPCKVVKTL